MSKGGVLMLKKTIVSLLLLCCAAPCLALPYESLTYLYGGTSPIYQNNIARTRGSLSTVVIDYFHIDKDGNAALSKIPDRAFIQARQREGIRVVAFVSNHWDREIARKAMAKRSSVTTALADWVVHYGLDGLDVDIENLTHIDRDAFTDFVRLLSVKLPKSKLLTAAVAANPHRWTTGWHGMYDYPALGRLCDAVMLMTYDQSYEGSAPGPVASYGFTEASVKEALRHIPSDKLIMGVPFYGRYWASLSNGGRIAGRAFTVSDIGVITAHYRSSKWYDNVSHCARANVSVRITDPAMNLWGGRRLEPGFYDIWYEDEQSYAVKMELCHKYDLLGVGSWALGQEPEHIWKGYRLWLGGIPFTDLAGHWAEGSVAELYRVGLLSGVGDARAAPDREVTRAEVCVFLNRLLKIPAMAPPASAPAEIRNHWAAPHLWAAIRHGLMTGDSGAGALRYRPEDRVTRAELAQFALNALHVPSTIDYNQSFYPDVAPPMWYNNAAVTLRLFEIMTGMPDGTFRPHSRATRAETAVIIQRMRDAELKDFSRPHRSRNHSRGPQAYILDPR
jgi:spore germination protein YaaH